jgi:hypothetical protein
MGFKCSYFGVGPCVECTLEEASHAFGEIVAQPLVSDGELDDDGDFLSRSFAAPGWLMRSTCSRRICLTRRWPMRRHVSTSR